MAYQTIEKLNTNISRLQKEVEFLRSFVIGAVGKDQEGEYKPEFVRRILKASQKNKNLHLKTGWRVIFEFINPETIKLIEVGHRKDIYK